jgi:tetratricopeptide (TPR) repeat protein
MTPAPPWRRPALAAFAILAAAYVGGSLLRPDPDFDVTFGIESWRGTGPVAAAAAALVVAIVVFVPRVADETAAAAARATSAVPRRARLPLLCAVAAVLFASFPDVTLSGDAMDAVRRTAIRSTQPSNAATCWLHFAAADLFGADLVTTVRGVTVAAGVAGVALAVLTARSLYDDAPRRVAATVLLATTGSTALSFGSVEVYVPVAVAILAYLLAGVRALRGTGSRHLPPLVLGVAFALHGSAGLLLPSLAWLAWHGTPGGDGRGRRASLRVVAAGLLFLVPVAATFLGLWLGSWHGALPAPGPERWGSFLGAMDAGPLLVLDRGPADVGRCYVLLEWEHTLAVLMTLFAAAPAAWALLAASALAPRRGGAEAPPDRRSAGFAIAALVPWIAYACVWNVSYPLRHDWDMFTPAGAIAAFAAAIFVLRECRDRAAAVRVTALCLYAFVPFVASHAGDLAERRSFAQVAATTIERWPDVRGDDLRRAYVRAWDDETRRLDVSGAAARIDEGDVEARANRLAEAAAKYGEAVAAEPDNVVARLCRGRTFLRLGRRDEARSDLTAALSTPSFVLRVLARHDLARIALEDGDAREAVRQLERSLHECSWTADPGPRARLCAQAWRKLGRPDLAAEFDRFADAASPR